MRGILNTSTFQLWLCHFISWGLFWPSISSSLKWELLLSHFSRVQLLCDPIDGSPPGSSDPGILQARTLERVAISFSNAWKWKVKVKSLSRVWHFTTPSTAVYQAPPSLGFSRQEHWSGLPFPPPMHESVKWKGSLSVLSDSLQPHGLQPTRLLCPWDLPGKSTGVGCHRLLRYMC